MQSNHSEDSEKQYGFYSAAAHELFSRSPTYLVDSTGAMHRVPAAHLYRTPSGDSVLVTCVIDGDEAGDAYKWADKVGVGEVVPFSGMSV